jgi:predicted DNA-binding ribbon-helix-helix protein
MALTKRGGYKPGGGRPKGSNSGRGVPRLLTLKPELWEAIDKLAEKRHTTPLRLIYSVLEEKVAEWEG